ncbi:MAG TPA: hypothetical protein VNN19_01515 [bacterium]|nr:hypothetical protein [bacterium]
MTESIGILGSAYRWLFKTLAAAYLRSKGNAEAAPFPWFADEQLSHATYLFLGDQPCSEAVILDALRDGRTAVSRGHIEFLNLEPMPSFSVVHQAPVHIHLHLPVSYSEPRPRSTIVFRDGQIVHWEPYSVVEPSLHFTYTDLHAPAGLHAYQVYVPSKFLSSPILFEVPTAAQRPMALPVKIADPKPDQAAIPPGTIQLAVEMSKSIYEEELSRLALDGLLLAVDHFNRRWDRGRPEAVLLSLGQA